MERDTIVSMVNIMKSYNAIITRNGETVKEIHSNDSLYCWKQIKKYFYDSYGNKYLDKRNGILHITFGMNEKERSLEELQEACWINGHYVH